jgi:hypothetical protein
MAQNMLVTDVRELNIKEMGLQMCFFPTAMFDSQIV